MTKKNKKLSKGFTRTPKFGVTPKGGGFTLVETLVAISIFTVSLLGIMSVLASSISNTTYAKEKIVAAYLAQEGIEYIRNMRDTFVLYDANGSQHGWSLFTDKLMSASCHIDNGCYFNDQNLDYANPSQPMTGIILTACGASCPLLLYDGTTGKYGYASGVNSNFTRKIKIAVVGPNEIKIYSTVFWTQGSGNYNIVFSESLFNWME